jgi:hypothetical protein
MARALFAFRFSLFAFRFSLFALLDAGWLEEFSHDGDDR